MAKLGNGNAIFPIGRKLFQTNSRIYQPLLHRIFLHAEDQVQNSAGGVRGGLWLCHFETNDDLGRSDSSGEC